MKKLIVWDLFGGLNGSVAKAIGHEKYDIYTFDILPFQKDGTPNIVIDLANTVTPDMYKKLKQYPHPDIIVASPPCQSFSRAAAMKGGNASWKIENGEMHLREEKEYIGTRYNYASQREKALLGFNCINHTIKIISFFRPKFYYIENPQSSLIWKMIGRWNYLTPFTKIQNITHYGAYGFEAKKPTIFLSNIEMDLKLADKETKFTSFEYLKNQKNRSDIPEGVIQHIFEYFNKE